MYNSSGNSYDFGSRMFNSRLGRWFSVDKQAARYTSYSPYHFGYCNPIAVKDDNGEENIVVVGNQSSSPSSDKRPWYLGGGYRYGDYRRHFLQKGLEAAYDLKKNHTENGETTTLIIYEGDYSKEELDVYEQAANKLGIHVKRVTTSQQVIGYINSSGGFAHNIPSQNGRGDDLITDFVYVGHGLWNSFLLGHGQDDKQRINIGDLSKDAFYKSCNATLYGCGNGLDMASHFRKDLVGGNVTGFRTTAIWGGQGLGTVAPHTQEYTRPGLGRYSPTRKDLPEGERKSEGKGENGSEGKVNGDSQPRFY